MIDNINPFNSFYFMQRKKNLKLFKYEKENINTKDDWY